MKHVQFLNENISDGLNTLRSDYWEGTGPKILFS